MRDPFGHLEGTDPREHLTKIAGVPAYLYFFGGSWFWFDEATNTKSESFATPLGAVRDARKKHGGWLMTARKMMR